MPTREDMDEIDLFGIKVPNKSVTVKYKVLINLYSAKAPLMASTLIPSETNRAKPCLEGMDEIQFDQNEKNDEHENALFGPTNNRYEKKSIDKLIEEIKWMDKDNANSKDNSTRELHESNKTRLLKFEDYKEEMING